MFPPLNIKKSKYYSEYENGDEISFNVLQDSENFYLYTLMDNSNLIKYLEDKIPTHDSNHKDDEYWALGWLANKYGINAEKDLQDEINKIMEEED